MNGENLIFIYSPQDGERETLWCSKLAQELKCYGNEVWVECNGNITNKINRAVNLWSFITILVCSRDFLNELSKPKNMNADQDPIISNQLFTYKLDMERLIVCLHDMSGLTVPDFPKNIISIDLDKDAKNIAAILEIKRKVSRILNVEKS